MGKHERKSLWLRSEDMNCPQNVNSRFISAVSEHLESPYLSYLCDKWQGTDVVGPIHATPELNDLQQHLVDIQIVKEQSLIVT